MSIAFSLLLVAIAAAPASIAFDGIAAQSLIECLAAIALALVLTNSRAADVNFGFQASRRLKLAAAAPAIWMVLQLIPMPIAGLSHSIWINADEALNSTAFGHISIDIGRTAEALIFYAGNIAMIVAGIFVFRDRRRAEITLLILAAMTALFTAVLVILKFVPAKALAAMGITEILGAVSSLGIILAIAAATRVIERAENRRSEPGQKAPNIQAALTLVAIELLACLVGLAVAATLNVALVAAFGVTAFGSIQIIRRMGRARWTSAVLIATLIIAASMVVFWRYNSGGSLSPFLQFATAASADSVSVAQRMLSDAGWLGTGAGTYLPLLPIYHDPGGVVTVPPSTAAQLAIELGKPGACIVLILCALLVSVLYLGALNRGRDSCYPAAAAACAFVFIGDAFCDASMLYVCVIVLANIVIGLGLAQSIGSGT